MDQGSGASSFTFSLDPGLDLGLDMGMDMGMDMGSDSEGLPSLVEAPRAQSGSLQGPSGIQRGLGP